MCDISNGMPRKLRLSTNVEQAENGYILRLSREGGGKNGEYVSKTLVAPNERAAIKIASAHFSGLGKIKGKNGKKKSVKSKTGLKK